MSDDDVRVLLLVPVALCLACLPTQEGGTGPIVAADKTWTFIPFPESRCANGTSTGIGVNLAPGSDRLVIYLQGGGACSNAAQCFGPIPGAVNMAKGYGVDQFRVEGNLSGIVLLDRLALDNPFRDAHMVFIPYCTGDLHAGDAAATYETSDGPRTAEHRGHHNLRVFLERVAQTFPDVTRVHLTGASAGGFGALFNAHTVRVSFAGTRVDVLSDSGPPIAVPPALADAWRERWSLQLPPDCGDCGAQPERILEHAAAAQPASRVGVLGSARDGVLALYAGVDGADIEARMGDVRTRVDGLPNVEAFVVSGPGHVVIANRLARSDGVSLTDWLAAYASDEAGWRSAWPD